MIHVLSIQRKITFIMKSKSFTILHDKASSLFKPFCESSGQNNKRQWNSRLNLMLYLQNYVVFAKLKPFLFLCARNTIYLISVLKSSWVFKCHWNDEMLYICVNKIALHCSLSFYAFLCFKPDEWFLLWKD